MKIEMETGWDGGTEEREVGRDRYQADTRMERQRWAEMRLMEILGRETGTVKEKSER